MKWSASRIMVAVCLAVALAGCGSKASTVTVTKLKTVTVTVPSTAATGSTTPQAGTTAASTTTASTSAPLVPLGQTADIGAGWTLTVNAARSTAANAPAGARNVTLSVVLGYRGNGESIAPLSSLPGDVFVEGAHSAPYNWMGCAGPALDVREAANAGGIKLFSGAAEHNRMCFQVATNDVSTIQLHIAPPSDSKLPSVRFALR
jgi:hypothetical protein